MWRVLIRPNYVHLGPKPSHTADPQLQQQVLDIFISVDFLGPDGISYPDFRGIVLTEMLAAGVEGGIPVAVSGNTISIQSSGGTDSRSDELEAGSWTMLKR